MSGASATENVVLPRAVITYCTQCRWMLRAAYYAQELLSTFGNPAPPSKDGVDSTSKSSGDTAPVTLGEVALRPATGGKFVVELIYHDNTDASSVTAESDGARVCSTVLWDRKRDGGFPETKVLKQRVRDVIDPTRGLGHVDRVYHAAGNGNKDSVDKAGADGAVGTKTANGGNQESAGGTTNQAESTEDNTSTKHDTCVDGNCS